MSHFLSLQEVIMARLRAALDTAGFNEVPVLAYPHTTNVEGEIPSPSVIVAFDGFKPSKDDKRCRTVELQQTWAVQVCIRKTVVSAEALELMAKAGGLVDLCITSIMGLADPGHSTQRMRLASPANPFVEDGYYYLPIAFESEIIRKSTNFLASHI